MQRKGASPGAQPAQTCESSVEIPEIRKRGVKGEGQAAGGSPGGSSTLLAGQKKKISSHLLPAASCLTLLLWESEGNSWHGAEQPSEYPSPEVHPAGFSAFRVWGSCQKAVVFCPADLCPHPFCMALRQRRRDEPSGCCRLCASSQDPVTHSGFHQLWTELKRVRFLFRVVSGLLQVLLCFWLLSFPSSGYFFLSWCFK